MSKTASGLYGIKDVNIGNFQQQQNPASSFNSDIYNYNTTQPSKSFNKHFQGLHSPQKSNNSSILDSDLASKTRRTNDPLIPKGQSGDNSQLYRTHQNQKSLGFGLPPKADTKTSNLNLIDSGVKNQTRSNRGTEPQSNRSVSRPQLHLRSSSPQVQDFQAFNNSSFKNEYQKQSDVNESSIRKILDHGNNQGHSERNTRTSFFTPTIPNEPHSTNMVPTQQNSYRNQSKMALTPTYDLTDKYLNNMHSSRPMNLKTVNLDQYEKSANIMFNNNDNFDSKLSSFVDTRRMASPNQAPRRDRSSNPTQYMTSVSRKAQPPQLEAPQLKADNMDEVARPKNISDVMNNMAGGGFQKTNQNSYVDRNNNHLQKKENSHRNNNTNNNKPNEQVYQSVLQIPVDKDFTQNVISQSNLTKPPAYFNDSQRNAGPQLGDKNPASHYVSSPVSSNIGISPTKRSSRQQPNTTKPGPRLNNNSSVINSRPGSSHNLQLYIPQGQKSNIKDYDVVKQAMNPRETRYSHNVPSYGNNNLRNVYAGTDQPRGKDFNNNILGTAPTNSQTHNKQRSRVTNNEESKKSNFEYQSNYSVNKYYMNH